MQITKQSTSHVNVDNLKKLITQALSKVGYSTKSISFSIVSDDRKSKKTVHTAGWAPLKTVELYGATCNVEEFNAKLESNSWVKVSDATQVKITEDELLALAKDYLLSQGYKLVEQPYFDFAWEDNSDGQFYSSSQVFNGIKCLTNKEVKNINIVGE